MAFVWPSRSLLPQITIFSLGNLIHFCALNMIPPLGQMHYYFSFFYAPHFSLTYPYPISITFCTLLGSLSYRYGFAKYVFICNIFSFHHSFIWFLPLKFNSLEKHRILFRSRLFHSCKLLAVY